MPHAGSLYNCRKPDWIKIDNRRVLDATKKGSQARLRCLRLMLKACCEEAHQAGLRVAAHAESPKGKVALENGVDTIEHEQQWMKRSWRYSGRMPAISVRYPRRFLAEIQP